LKNEELSAIVSLLLGTIGVNKSNAGIQNAACLPAGRECGNY
jgi:hypothetical protein